MLEVAFFTQFTEPAKLYFAIKVFDIMIEEDIVHSKMYIYIETTKISGIRKLFPV